MMLLFKVYKIYKEASVVKYFLLILLIILTPIGLVQADPSEFNAKELKKLHALMPDIFRPKNAQKPREIVNVIDNRTLFFDQKIKKPQVIKVTPRKKILKVNNTGDVGGYFKIKITGNKKKIQQYERNLKIYDLKMTKKEPEKYQVFSSKIDKIIARDRQIRLDRKKKIVERVTRDLEIREARKLRNLSQVERDKKIREDRKARSDSIAKLMADSKQSKPSRYNPKKDLLIEISFHDGNTNRGFFMMSFDPDIEKGERHFYRPNHIGKDYTARASLSKGQINLQLAERGKVDRNGRYQNILAEQTVGVNLINSVSYHSSNDDVFVDLIISSVDDISTYTGSIAGSTGWSGF